MVMPLYWVYTIDVVFGFHTITTALMRPWACGYPVVLCEFCSQENHHGYTLGSHKKTMWLLTSHRCVLQWDCMMYTSCGAHPITTIQSGCCCPPDDVLCAVMYCDGIKYTCCGAHTITTVGLGCCYSPGDVLHAVMYCDGIRYTSCGVDPITTVELAHCCPPGDGLCTAWYVVCVIYIVCGSQSITTVWLVCCYPLVMVSLLHGLCYVWFMLPVVILG